ncbi:MAG: carboxypeptidase M32 [Luteolibacter sp.]|uniref:carboxypeptidase M32 n=1 Tax=Luteolibacter sp. TaxID=1962973 RepID=UPI00326457E7
MSIFEKARELAVINSSAAVIGWDQETYLPSDAAKYRADQLAWLSSRAHELATSDAWKADLEAAEAADAGTDFKHTANLRELRREFDRATKLTVELVARDSVASSLAKHAWADARERSDFSRFAPHLETLLGIAREKADLWGYRDEPYDALLEGYERATSTAAVAALFDAMRPSARETAAKAVENSRSHAPSLPPGPYPVAAQQRFNSQVAESIGFDFDAGRIDTTTHPFCTTLGPRDIRLTTRYMESDFTSSLFGVLHEAGHGLYEQGLPAEDFGLPSGNAVSLGIHESQSRLWENHVGRSREFWEKWYPAAQESFPQLAGFPLEKFLRYLWRAEFSPIRVEADEATYDLHILLRFGIERQMMNGSLAVADVPNAWNEGFRELFGFAPEDDRHGCLQDIHWSMGGLGYFATYTLGNINSAQLFAAARKDPSVASAIQQADYRPLLGWLRKSVHAYGSTLDPAKLIEQATGSAPSTADYLAHLQSRYL